MGELSGKLRGKSNKNKLEVLKARLELRLAPASQRPARRTTGSSLA